MFSAADVPTRLGASRRCCLAACSASTRDGRAKPWLYRSTAVSNLEGFFDAAGEPVLGLLAITPWILSLPTSNWRVCEVHARQFGNVPARQDAAQDDQQQLQLLPPAPVPQPRQAGFWDCITSCLMAPESQHPEPEPAPVPAPDDELGDMEFEAALEAEAVYFGPERLPPPPPLWDILEVFEVASEQLLTEAEAAADAAMAAAPAALAQAFSASASTPSWEAAVAATRSASQSFAETEAADVASSASASASSSSSSSSSTPAKRRRIVKLQTLTSEKFCLELDKVGPKHNEASHRAGGGHNLVAHGYQHYRLLCLLAGVSESNLPPRLPPDSTASTAPFSVRAHYGQLKYDLRVRLSLLLRLFLVTGTDTHSQFRMLREKLPNLEVTVDSMQLEFDAAAFSSHPVSKLLLGGSRLQNPYWLIVNLFFIFGDFDFC